MKHPERVTSSGRPPEPGFEDAPAPGPLKPNGQHSDYWVLSEAERAKGFVRPVRRTYRHVGERPQYPTRPLTEAERARYADVGYVAYEQYPGGEFCDGRYWTAAQLASGCGAATTMSVDIAETYAREPNFYGATFCVACGRHGPVAEFVWDDGSGERVGS